MRIAMIAEGSYPYVTGGVSSWIHALMTSMPEHEFVLYVIGAEQKQKGQFKYKLPSNLVEVHEHFLDAHLQDDAKWGRSYSMSEQQYEALRAFIGGTEKVDWDDLFQWFSTGNYGSASSFLMSRDFFDILQDLSKDRYEHVPFTEWFWMVRSMILPLFVLMREPLPEADVYHAVTTGYAGMIGSYAKWKTGKPLLLTEHGIYSREREEEIIKSSWVPGHFKELWIEYFYTLSSCAYDNSDQVITLFGRNQEIEIELGCSPDKISIIPNGVDVEAYKNLMKPITDAQQKKSKIRIGAIVRVVPIKDIKTMIQAYAIAKQEFSDSELIIMGPYAEDPEYYEECLALVEALQVQDITFTGNVQIKDMLGDMDLLLLTSISEGQPLAVLEGLAAGKPFVTTDVGSCKELLYGRDDSYGPAGIVAPVMHVEKLAAAIVELCQDEQLRLKMGEAGQNRVRHEYTHHKFIAAYQSIYAASMGGS